MKVKKVQAIGLTFLSATAGDRDVCQPAVPGPRLHDNASVHLESAEPVLPTQLLWAHKLSGTVPAVGAAGLLTHSGQLGDC